MKLNLDFSKEETKLKDEEKNNGRVHCEDVMSDLN